MKKVYSPEAKTFVTGGVETFGFPVPSIGAFIGNGSRYIFAHPPGGQIAFAESAILNSLERAELTTRSLLRHYFDVDTVQHAELVGNAEGIEVFQTQGNFHEGLYRAIDLLVDYDRLVHLAKRNPDVGEGRDATIRLATQALIRSFRLPRKLLGKMPKP